MIELEVKFAVSKIPDSLIKNVPVAEKEQLDIYYDTFDYQLLKNGNFLRIRNEEKLDFKLDLGDDSHLFCEETSFDREKLSRKKKELELIFNRLGLSFNSDFTDLTGFLEKNGLTVLAPVKKKRKEYKINEINITLDDVEDLGIYIEAEKIFETDTISEKSAETLKIELLDLLYRNQIISLEATEVKVGYVELYLLKYNKAAYDMGKFKE